MEDKYCVNQVLAFGPASVQPALLEKTLVGNEDILERLVNSVKSIAEDNINLFTILIGPRGMGKTHLLRILYSRIQHYEKDFKLKITFYLGKSYGVDSYFDFLFRLVTELIKEDKPAQQSLYDTLGEVKGRIGGKPFVILENIIKERVGDLPST